MRRARDARSRRPSETRVAGGVPLLFRLELNARDHHREDCSARGAYARLFVRARGGRGGRPGRFRADPRGEGLRLRRLGARRPLGQHRAPPRAQGGCARWSPAAEWLQKVKNQGISVPRVHGFGAKHCFRPPIMPIVGDGVHRENRFLFRKRGQLDPIFFTRAPVKPSVKRSRFNDSTKISPPGDAASGTHNAIARSANGGRGTELLSRCLFP